jgi:hypothetical protein
MQMWFLVFWAAVSFRSHATNQAVVPIWQPPPIGADKSSPATVSKELATWVRVGGIKLVLEETPLDAVRNRFGGSLGHSRDAGDSLDWLCVQGADARGSWVLWLLSGEIH